MTSGDRNGQPGPGSAEPQPRREAQEAPPLPGNLEVFMVKYRSSGVEPADGGVGFAVAFLYGFEDHGGISGALFSEQFLRGDAFR